MNRLPETLICRECQMVAKPVYVDDLMVGCTCLSCGVSVKDDAFAEMLEKQVRYLARKNVRNTTRRLINRGFPKLMAKILTEPEDPGSPFIIVG